MARSEDPLTPFPIIDGTTSTIEDATSITTKLAKALMDGGRKPEEFLTSATSDLRTAIRLESNRDARSRYQMALSILTGPPT